MTENHWINVNESNQITSGKIILFGAGKGSEEFIKYLHESSSKAQIIGITDNDASFWGADFLGFDIISPSQLGHMIFDKIVITSISGRDAIAEQLCRMGFTPDLQFVCVGRYPQAYSDAFLLLSKELLPFFDLQNKKCLHIGPGGFLGLEVLLYCGGAAKVCSIDKFAFNICYPEITNSLGDYNSIKNTFENFLPQIGNTEKALSRFDGIFDRKQNRTFIDNKKITYIHPMDVCDLSYGNETFDLVISFAVLEHVTDPDAAAAEIARVLKPGGISLHKIITRDHRSFSKIQGLTPFSFRQYSQPKWEEIIKNKFHQNRLLPCEWKDKFLKNGLLQKKYEVEEQTELDEKILTSFHSDFSKFSPEELGEINCLVINEKQATI